MLQDVLIRVAAETGLHPEQKRKFLLTLLNSTAKQMHKELECNKICRETTLVVPRDKVVSLPSFIGELRGIRKNTEDSPVDLQSLMSPRYVSEWDSYLKNNWRDLGESPVHTVLDGAQNLTITCASVESPNVSILIAGETSGAARVEESILVDSTSVISTNVFGPTIYSIACITANRQSDLIVKNEDGTEIATLYNTDTKTRYKIIDVSQVFWSVDTTADESLIDVCYKLPAINLWRNSDSFYAGDDYDEAWFNLCMYNFLKPIKDRIQDALIFRGAYADAIRADKESGESGIIKKISFGPSKYHNIIDTGSCIK